MDGASKEKVWRKILIKFYLSIKCEDPFLKWISKAFYLIIFIKKRLTCQFFIVKGKIVFWRIFPVIPWERERKISHLKHTSLLVLYIKTLFFLFSVVSSSLSPRIVCYKHLNFSIRSTGKKKQECTVCVCVFIVSMSFIYLFDQQPFIFSCKDTCFIFFLLFFSFPYWYCCCFCPY